MKIIIEGPDNVGKSTLIRNIIEEFKVPWIYICGYKIPKGSKEFQENLEKDIKMNFFDCIENSKYIISDRNYLSTYVYSPLYRGYNGDFVFKLEKQYNLDDWTLILLTDEIENLIKRDDGLSFSTNFENKQKELQLFKEGFEKSHIQNKKIFNVSELNEENLKNKVIQYLKEIYL